MPKEKFSDPTKFLAFLKHVFTFLQEVQDPNKGWDGIGLGFIRDLRTLPVSATRVLVYFVNPSTVNVPYSEIVG